MELNYISENSNDDIVEEPQRLFEEIEGTLY
jgi:hypothetical protein